MDPALAREVAVMAKVRAINEAIDKGDSEVQQFYKDTTILISGGSGFMGKQLLEKLFRSCNIKKIFLLMRSKKNKGLRERLDLILEDSVFDTVKKMHPGFEKKICPMEGDIAQPGLGISPEDRAAIIEETNVIIHAAATINFEEPLKIAVNTNVRGTVEMLNIGKRCKNLKSYVHVSTAYSHATFSRANQPVDEQFYEAALSPQLAIEMVETMDEKRLIDITPKLIQNWPNTYTFTKAIAEEAVRQVSSELPISIVRPAIVISSLVEPSPGWLDTSCAFGPSGIVLGAALGVVHTMLCRDSMVMNLVPVDYANNAIILAGWDAAKRREQGNYEPKIYTVTSSDNPLRVDVLIQTIRDMRDTYMTPKVMYYAFFESAGNPVMYTLLFWLLHYIPAYIGDFVLRLMGRKPIAVKLYSKMHKLEGVVSYFMFYKWVFGNKNLVGLFSGLNATDKIIYNCDLNSFKWKDLVVTWALGTRKYLIKDGLQNTELGIKKQFRFKILHYTVVAPLYLYLIYKVAMLAFKLVYFVLSTFYFCL